MVCINIYQLCNPIVFRSKLSAPFNGSFGNRNQSQEPECFQAQPCYSVGNHHLKTSILYNCTTTKNVVHKVRAISSPPCHSKLHRCQLFGRAGGQADQAAPAGAQQEAVVTWNQLVVFNSPGELVTEIQNRVTPKISNS